MPPSNNYHFSLKWRMCPFISHVLHFLQCNPCFLPSTCNGITYSGHEGRCVHADWMPRISLSPQITRNHYQNALTATRMDSSPQTPDPVDPDAKGRPPVPEARSHSIALPLTHTHTRMGLARLAHLHPHGGLRNTSQLNERNRIVRKYITSQSSVSP